MSNNNLQSTSYAKVLPAAGYGANQLGLFATTDLSAWCDITFEKPILSIWSAETSADVTRSHTKFFSSLSALSPQDLISLKNLSYHSNDLQVSAEVKDFEKLARPPAETTEDFERLALKTFFSHSIPFGFEDQPETHRLFRKLCFLNHSCAPNAVLCWDSKTGEMTLHATRHIRKGDEILVSYLTNPFQTRDARRNELGFACRCAICSANKEVVERVYHVLAKAWEILEQTHTLLLPRPIPADLSELSNADWKQLCAIANHAGPESRFPAVIEDFFKYANKLQIMHVNLARVYELRSAAHLAWFLTHPSNPNRERCFHEAILAKAREFRVLFFCVGVSDKRGMRALVQLWYMFAESTEGKRDEDFQKALNGVGLEKVDGGNGRWSIGVKE